MEKGKVGVWCIGDRELLVRLSDLSLRERALVADIIATLAEVDARKLYREYAFSSMFAYATSVLCWSESAAYKRIGVARAAREVPAVIDALADGTLTLSSAAVLAPILRKGEVNAEALLKAAAGKSKRQVEALVADLDPKPAVATSVTALGDDRFAITFTASGAFTEKLAQAQALLSHSVPDGNVAEVLERALDSIIKETRKRQFAETDKPRATPVKVKPGSRHIPASVKRAVVERDGERCAWVSPDGRRCQETRRLQFHHIEAYANGGPPTVENTMVCCDAHNRYEGEQEFPGVAARIRERRAREKLVHEKEVREKRARQAKTSQPPAPKSLQQAQWRADTISALANLGFSVREARAAVAASSRGRFPPASSFEEFLRRALRALAPRYTRRAA